MERARFVPVLATLALGLLFTASPLTADTRIEKDLRLSPGGKLIVDAAAGSVEIKGSSRSGAHVLVTSRRDDLEDRYELKFEEGAGTVTVTARRRGAQGGWFHWTTSDEAPHFVIDVPKETALQVATGGGHVSVASISGDSDLRTSGGHLEIADLTGKLEASTSGGHISVRHVDGDTDIHTSGGHIDADGIKGSLQARTSGGHVSLKDVTGDIKTETSGGHIDIENAGGRVEAGTSGGAVNVSFVRGNERGGRLRSSGGGIHVKIDKGANLDIDAETGGGHVSADLPVTVQGGVSKSSLRGKLGGGGHDLVLRTSGGHISIESL